MHSSSEPAYRGRVKYTEAKVRSYQNLPESKNRAELRLIGRAFRLIPSGRVLDAPCGGGRVSLFLASQGYQMRAGDLSEAMCAATRENFEKAEVNIPVDAEDAEKLTYANLDFDAVICLRLFHHFPDPQIRERVVRELCRVTRGFVAVSYFSPNSITSLRRRWQAAWSGRVSGKHSTSLREVEAYFGAAGFRLVQDFARLPLIHTLHIAVFQRVDP